MASGQQVILGACVALAAAVAVFFALQVFETSTYVDTDAAPVGRPAEQALIVLPSLADTMAADNSRQQEEPARAVTVETFVGNGSPALGSPSAPVILVEFGDYQCHFCNVFFQETKGLIVGNYIESGHVRMIFKDYHIVGPDSVTASHAVHCAGSQGMFWEYHYALYDNWAGENTGWASQDGLSRIASAVPGLDHETWLECLDEIPHSALIYGSNEDGRALGLTGTPTFFVIGPDGGVEVIVGAEPYSVFADRLDAAIAKSNMQS